MGVVGPPTTGRAGARACSDRAQGSGRRLAILLVAVLAASLLTPAAVAADTSPPILEDARKVNDTTIMVVLSDETNVSLASIDAADFTLDTGEITSVAADRSGTRALVTIHLASEVPAYEVAVGLSPDADIADTVGNVIDPSAAPRLLVTGMDGVAPDGANLSVHRSAAGAVVLTVTADEPLTGMNVSIAGPTSRRIDASRFHRVENGTYRATYVPPTDGTYVLVLLNATDRAGNTATFSRRRTITVDTTPPTVAPVLDLAGSDGLTYTFRGRATDENAVVGYHWTFGDGTAANGTNVTHTFPSPGHYTVRLNATDEFGNTGTATVSLTVPPAAGRATGNTTGGNVTVRRAAGAAAESVVISAPGLAAGTPLRLGTAAGRNPLVRHHGVALAGLNVSVRAPLDLSLAISAANGTRAPTFTNATDAAALATFTVLDTSPAGAVGTVRFELQVATRRLPADPSNASVRLYRQSNGSWSALPTTRTSVANGTAHYTARSPGFSRFVVGVTANRSATGTPNGTTQTPSPTATGETTATGSPGQSPVVVTNATLNTTQIPAGGAFRVNVTVRNTGDRRATFVAGVSLDGTVVETVPIPPIPADAVQHTEVYVEVGNRTGALPVSVNGTQAGTIQVGSAGGGGLLGSVLGLFGFLPLGILEPLFVYLGVPLLVVFLALKALAIYLGY